MVGLILCGGQSVRMGTDKGLIQQAEKTWAQTAVEKLALLSIPVKVSVNKKQQDVYAAIFSQDDLIIDNESLDLKGPLLGVLSCHLAFPGEDLFVLACDMLHMKTDLLFTLQEKHQQQTADAYIFSNDGKAEPLCGIYTARSLACVCDLYKTKKLHTFSMKFILQQLNVCSMPLKNEEKKYFHNFNSPADSI
jgi:molybdenum cofactor guanylyltransferase